MKYLKMIVMPALMIAIAMPIMWGMETTTGFVQMLWVALMIASMVGMCAWDFIGLKTSADIWFAVIALLVVGGGLKAILFWVVNWPGVATGQPPIEGFDLIAIASRLWAPLLNWWTFGGLVLGSAVSALVLIWLQRTKQI